MYFFVDGRTQVSERVYDNIYDLVESLGGSILVCNTGTESTVNDNRSSTSAFAKEIMPILKIGSEIGL